MIELDASCRVVPETGTIANKTPGCKIMLVNPLEKLIVPENDIAVVELVVSCTGMSNVMEYPLESQIVAEQCLIRI